MSQSSHAAAGAIPNSPLFSQRERLWPVILVSLLVPAGLIGAAVLHPPTTRIDLGQKPIVAKLVRLGEKKPQQYLPRKEEAAPPPAPAAAAVPIPTAKPAPPPPPAKAVAAKATPAAPKPAPAGRKAPENGRGDVLASVLSRVRKDKAAEPVYGDPNGDPRGDASEAEAGDQYLALVERSLRESYVLPSTISERDRMHLKATLVLYIDADGRVLRFAFENRSGNGAFDAALERAVHAARLPPPPPELRSKYRNEGLGVLYRP